MILFYLLLSHAFAQDPWPELKVGTWNVMQQPWITEWTDKVNANIDTNDLDVLHIAEVWTSRERDAILNNPKIREAFPFVYVPTVRNEKCGCNITNDPELAVKIQQFLGCAALYGIDIRQLIQPYPTPLPFICNLAGIGVALHNYDTNNFLCLACVINTAQTLPTHLSPPEGIQLVLANCAMRNGNKFSYEGVNGQLILSKFQIRDVVESKFDGWLANRINVHATIRGVRFGFGHFAYNVIEDFNPAGKSLMYGDTQPQQAQDMLTKSPDVVIGDLNTGPDYQPDGYNMLLSAYRNVFSSQPPTYCPPTHANFTMCLGYAPQTIDHILVKNVQTLSFKNAATFNVFPLMSDHIGVRAVISKKP